jgi:threonine-phosphate decarboxylase
MRQLGVGSECGYASMIHLDRIHGGSAPEGVLDFSASINPVGPPPAALDAYHASIANISSYPPAYPHHLEEALAGWLGVEPEWVLAGNGSTQLIYLMARVLKPRHPVIATPTFSELANSLIVEGIKPRALNTTSECNFRLDPEAVIRCLRDGADAILIGRPNSPTGTIATMDEAAEIAMECERRSSWCVFDEAFIDFVQGARSGVEFVEKNHKVIVLRSLTKIFAIPGLRVGCAVGHPDAIGKLRDAIEPWSVNAVADRVTLACLDVAEEFVQETKDFVAVEVTRIADALSRVPRIRVFPSVANFMMMEIADKPIPGAFGKHMLDHGIRIRDLRTLPGCREGQYRIGIRARSEDDYLLEVARSWTPRKLTL